MDPPGSSNCVAENDGKQLILGINSTFLQRTDMTLLTVSQWMANKSVDWGLPAALVGQRVWGGKNRHSSSSCIKEQYCSEGRLDT